LVFVKIFGVNVVRLRW